MKLPNQDDYRLYLQLLQSAISKLGMNSLYCKTLCLTLTASFGFVGELPIYVYALSLTIIFLCMTADAIYLSLERTFRDKYNISVKCYRNSMSSSGHELVFDMDPGSEYKKIRNIINSIKSWTIYLVYPVPIIYMTGMLLVK